MEKATPHVMPYKALITVLCMLLLLTAATIEVSRIHLGRLNIWVALLIAATKASLVISFFMHIKYENRVVKIALAVTLFCVAILIGFIFWDVSFR